MTTPDALAEATGLAERAGELTRAPWDQLDGTEAVGVAEAIVAARSLLDAALLRVTERLEDTDAVRELGWASVKDYLTHLTGGHQGAGGGLVRTVEQLRDVPAVQAALEDGRLTLPQARAIATRVQTLPRQAPDFRADVAQRLLDAVETDGHDASALRGRVFDDVVRALDPDGRIIDADQGRAQAERGAHHGRFLSFAEDDLGGVWLKGYGTCEDVEKIKTVLFPLAAPVTTEPGACGGRRRRPGEPTFDDDGDSTQVPCHDPRCAHDGRDPRDHGRRLWDALVDSCDRLRATGTLPRDHGAIPKVLVLIDHASLQQQVIDAGLAGPGRTPTGTSLSAHAVRRLACDAELVPAVLGSEGQVLDVGRTHRLVTPALWNALLARDQHCAFPGCTRPPLACDAHHLTHWADGGATSLENLVMLCRHHHTLVHNSPWAVRIDPDTRQPVWRAPPRTTLAKLRRRATYHPPREPGRRSSPDPGKAA